MNKMETVKKLIMLQVPTSICNFRCHYCYLAQRDVSFQGEQANMQYSPEHVARALSPKRLGGICFINACAEGETLLTNNIDQYFKALVSEGHFLEIVTNMTVTPMIDKILSWETSLLSHIEFKCSFHYLELKKRGLLEVFANNVEKAWNAGASYTIEIAPSDELIPFIDEVKEFSLKHFGALPHLTITRDDTTKDIRKLTQLSDNDYTNTWKIFNSEFWEYKAHIYGVKQEQFCYAGLWSITVDIATGIAKKCYFNRLGNIFEDPNATLDLSPIGECPIAHCYNGHAFLTYGLIPGSAAPGYGDIRNRVRQDGTEWLQPELKAFFNTKLSDNNKEWSYHQKQKYLRAQMQQTVGLRGKLSKYRFYQKLHKWKESLK